ncbi:hypothetical protein FHT44_000445 [Mycolicibacterium sp. BK634]|uniref:glycosyltransferase family 39 protein n=1 Tax=Mycobacterium sp. BK086 TaxID=2512165 RepID=UPI0010EDA3DB|nr:glycosyltransferase family 39 protein [Mycobacterium sp. BK086]MBB3747984.1 hypothetical protein [Mycolicibacterium sp. BK634]TDO07881.1 dolichyl-phosphate-mannose-protein mannosyltransferase [Mycobacterium sp. BK086]
MTVVLTDAPATAAHDTPSTPPDPSVPGRWRGVALYIVLSALYFTVGYVLTVRYNMFDPDSTSRVANAGYVTQSRDPHLSAIGFVWNPLPSLVEIPILQFARWWPELRSHGIAGVVQSSLFMAGAAVMVRRIALDRGLGSGWRRLAVLCFALQPMIIVYGASGMSEAAEAFCVVWCTRHLLRWVEGRYVGDLALAGVALGVGYLARYEVVPVAVGVAAFVGFLVFRSAPRSTRMTTTAAHLAIVLFPIVTAASIWAAAGWVVNAELFATLTSRYGNGSQVAGAVARGGTLSQAASSDWVVVSARLFGMQPFVGIAAAGALLYAALSRRLTPLVPLVTFGPVLAFAAWGQFTSTTFGWFRFYLLAIPAVVCIALACWTSAPRLRTPWQAETPAAKLAAVLITLSILVGFPVTVRASLDERIGNQQLQFGFNSLLHPEKYRSQEQWYRRLMVNDRVLAQYLDRMQLPDGSVLMDTFNTWGVWLSSNRPKQFIVTSDYDFKTALNRPWANGVKYVLISNPEISDADAIDVRYPTLWYDGAGFGDLVLTIYGATGDERFRLYKVTGPQVSAASKP